MHVQPTRYPSAEWTLPCDDELVQRDVTGHLVIEVFDVEIPVVIQPGLVGDIPWPEAQSLARLANS